MKQELICIGCPMGCQLTAEVENGAVTSVTGNTCPRGDAYARRECVAPVLVILCGWDVYRSLTCCRQSPKIISSRSPMIQLFIITLSRSFLHLITQIVYAVFIPFATSILYIFHNLYLLFFDSLHNGTCRPYHI